MSNVIVTAVDVPNLATSSPTATAAVEEYRGSEGNNFLPDDWRMTVAFILFAYSLISFLVLMSLCCGGCLDHKLNLDINGAIHRNPYRHRQDTARYQPHRRPTSATTILGDGDEAELAAIRAQWAIEGIHVSERQLRSQRRRQEEFLAQATRDVEWAGSEDDERGDVEARQAERARRLNDAQVLANMRALGMI